VKNIKPSLATVLYVLALMGFVLIGSLVVSNLWGGKPQVSITGRPLVIEPEMSIAGFGKVNNLEEPVLKEIFNLHKTSYLEKRLKSFGTPEQIKTLINSRAALADEHASKDWVKILIKFVLWFVFLAAVFVYSRKRPITSGLRKGLLFFSLTIFGMILGSDPSPMGTVKDAIVLFAKKHVIFPPRLIAMGVFLAVVLLANKFICAWGCQAGTLQDLVFRLNQEKNGGAKLFRQIRLPFIISNSIRAGFFILFIATAYIWGVDLIGPVDPFKIYNPSYIGLVGGIFIGVLIMSSLFVYRPWCHLFCPFGLLGWCVEKLSLVKVSVDYSTCIACEKCVKACPSTVMNAILKRRQKIIPDCFACYACRDACPTKSVLLSTRKRTLPPEGHFDRKANAKPE
jgi:NAD-dependent dihydropyrimidine dehydrogenase PreA subunit